MRYARIYNTVPKPISKEVRFSDASIDKGYKDPVTNTIRVRTSSSGYISFGRDGSITTCKPEDWPLQFSDWAVSINIILKVERVS